MGKIIIRRDIQILRGLAVTAVVIFHINSRLYPMGYLGVDAFFVISGFVVTPLLIEIIGGEENKNRIIKLKAFFVRRFFRLAPTLTFVLMFSSIGVFLFGNPSDHHRFALQGLATLAIVGNLGAMKYSGNYFLPDSNPLVHTWSLSVEESIYIFFPLILLLITFNLKNQLKRMTIAFKLIGLTSFFLFIHPVALVPIFRYMRVADESSISFYSSFTRVWQFILGGMLFLNEHENVKEVRNLTAKIIAHFLLCILLIFPIFFQIPPKMGSLLASVVTVWLIHQRVLQMLPRVLSKTFEWIGYRSYSIYLVHMPLAYIAHYYSESHLLPLNSAFLELGAFSLSIGCGLFTYRFIETRFRYPPKQKSVTFFSTQRTTFLTLVLPVCLFLVMLQATSANYWGLNRNMASPPVDWNLRRSCTGFGVSLAPCTYLTQNAKGTVLFIGDSHAAHISNAVIRGSKDQNWNTAVWTLGGCNVRFSDSTKKQLDPSCILQNKRIFEWAKINRPKVTIVSQYVYSDIPQSDLRDALNQLYSLGGKVLLIQNNPIFPDKYQYMVQRPLTFKPYVPPKYFLETSMNRRDLKASNLLAAWARSHGISTLDLSSLFCGDGKCRRFQNNQWLYFDDNHFSLVGENLVTPEIETFLSQVKEVD